MTSKQRRNIQIPIELQNILTEMMVEFIMTSSTDFVDFAFNYFENKLRERQDLESLSTESEEKIDLGKNDADRREAVLGYDDEISSTSMSVINKTEEQQNKLIAILKKILLFKSLPSDAIDELIKVMNEKKVSAGEEVIRQGEDGYFFYVIEAGKFTAIQHGVVLKEYCDEGSFGELALMYNMPRACTVKAETDGTLWAIDRPTFRKVVVNSSLKKRRLYDELIDKVPMLSKLSPYERSNLVDAFVSETYPPGSVIIKEGDPADKMYFIQKGSVIVKTFDKITGEERIVNRLEEGEYFGELALINKEPRAASVVSVGHVDVVFVTVEAFERLLGPCMDVMKRKILDYDLKE